MLPDLHISAKNAPTIIFLIDQSGSMGEKLQDGRIKAEVIRDSVNRAINSLVKKSYNNFNYIIPIQIGIFGYGGRGIKNLLGYRGSEILHSLSNIANTPLRMEKRKKKEKSLIGEIFETEINFPVWVEASWFGETPMCTALFDIIKKMKELNRNFMSLPAPIIFNICDGKPTDGDVEDLGKMLLKFTFSAKGILLYNLHLAAGTIKSGEMVYPYDDLDLQDEFSKKLFQMSSCVPLHILPKSGKSYPLGKEPRGLMYNIQTYEKIVDFFNIINRCPIK